MCNPTQISTVAHRAWLPRKFPLWEIIAPDGCHHQYPNVKTDARVSTCTVMYLTRRFLTCGGTTVSAIGIVEVFTLSPI
jgi:hypothetical protein